MCIIIIEEMKQQIKCIESFICYRLCIVDFRILQFPKFKIDFKNISGGPVEGDVVGSRLARLPVDLLPVCRLLSRPHPLPGEELPDQFTIRVSLNTSCLVALILCLQSKFSGNLSLMVMGFAQSPVSKFWYHKCVSFFLFLFLFLCSVSIYFSVSISVSVSK